MSLIKFNKRNRLFPWTNDNLKSFFDSEDFFSTDFFEEDSLMPAMNVMEHDGDYEIEFAAPGFAKKDFEVTIDDNVLTVYGEKEEEEKEEKEDYTRREFSYNSFKRSLRLPNTINTNQEVKATYENGILKMNLQKKEEAKVAPKKVIEIS